MILSFSNRIFREKGSFQIEKEHNLTKTSLALLIIENQ